MTASRTSPFSPRAFEPKGETIRQLWEGYSAQIYANIQVSQVQYHETRQAFYSGCYALLSAMHTIADLPEDDGVEWLKARKSEIEADFTSRAEQLRAMGLMK